MDATPLLPTLLRGGLPPGSRPLTGSFLSADLSGFTRLSERLAGRGRMGAEVLADAVDGCFTDLVECVLRHGGDVLCFGGDAVFVAFDGSGNAGRAAGAAVEMQQVLRSAGRISTIAGNVRLSMSVGVATGTAQVVVGDGPQRPLFVVGPVVTRTVALEAAARAGEVLVAPGVARALGDPTLRSSPDARGIALAVPRRTAPPPAHPRQDPVDALVAEPMTAAATVHLPAALRARLLAGDAPQEHRRVVVAFVATTGLDRLSTAARAERLMLLADAVGAACARLDVCWVSTDVLADGAKAVLAAGLPLHSDDDELRMAAAARQLLEGPAGAHLAVGIQSGTAFVGSVGHPRRRTYTLMGDTVNTAARLMGAAGPGRALVGRAVAERLRGHHLLGDTVSLTVKGKATPVAATALGPPASSAPSRGEPADDGAASVIGRTAECAALDEALGARRSGAGGIIEIVAPAGMGKSHLLAWLRTRAAARGVPVAEATGRLAQADTPFAAISGALRPLVARSADDSPAEISPAEIRVLRRRFGDLAPLVAPAVGLAMEPTDASQAVQPGAATSRRAELLVEALATDGTTPAVLVAEDLHWFDTASHDLLAALAAELATRGWLVVATTRPGGPAWAAGARRLELGPLDAAALRAVALHRAGDRPLDDATLAEAVRRSAGNPLYLTQLVDAALGAEGIGLPESAERIVGARIDRLAPDERRRLRAASVLGSEADLALLATATGDGTMADPLVWAPLGEFARVGGGVLRFGHDLFRLAAYEGLPHAERVRLHGRIAEELEMRGDAPAAELATHHRHARQMAPAARWGRRAAEQAEEAAAWGDAARLWQEAADSAAAARLAADERCDLLVRLGGAREVLAQPDAAEAAYRAALRLATPERRCAIRSRLAWVAFRTDHFVAAKRRIAAATADLDTADSASRGALATQLQILRAAVASAEGAVAGADRAAREALRTATALGRGDLRAEALLQLAIDADLADTDDASTLAADALVLLTDEGMHYEQGLLHGNLGVTLMEHGDWIGALARFEAADEGFARSGNLFGRTLNDLNRAAILLEQGHLVDAADLLEDSRRRARLAGTERIVHFATGSLGRARAWQGDPDRGVREIRPAIEALDGLGQAHLADTLRSYLAEVLLLGGRLDEAAAEAEALGPSLRHHSAGQVVELTVERIGVLAHTLADPSGQEGPPADPARRAVGDLLERARSAGAAIEVARCLQALDLLDGATDPLRLMERQAVCDSLGVVWMPPVRFATTDATAQRVAGTAPG